MSRIGLIAGNGRFPFLVLQGARNLGHDVTIVAIKEEAFADLEGSAREARADFHWVSLGQLGKCIKVLKSAGVSQAVMAGQVKHVKIFSGRHPGFHAAGGAEAIEGAQYRCAHFGGGGGHARRGD